MPYCQMPFYYDGAIFHHKDFDAKKLLAFCLNRDGAKKSDIRKISRLSYKKHLTKKMRKILDTVIDTEGAKTLADLREDIITYIPDELVNGCLLDGEEYIVRRFDGSESAEFNGADNSYEDIDDCFFITIPSIFPWKASEYTGPKSEKEAVQYVKERIGHLVKDDIDWTERLGELSGIYAD